MRSRNDNNLFVGLYLFIIQQFYQHCKGYSCVWTTEQPRSVRLRGSIRKFVLRSLLYNTIELFQNLDRLFITDRIAYLNGVGEGLLCLHGFKFFKTIQITKVQRVCLCGLRTNDTRQFIYQAQFLHQEKSFSQSRGVTQVSSGHNHNVRPLPLKLLDYFYAYRLLP